MAPAATEGAKAATLAEGEVSAAAEGKRMIPLTHRAMTVGLMPAGRLLMTHCHQCPTKQARRSSLCKPRRMQ